MIHFPSTSKGFLSLFNLSVRHHFVVFRKTFWLIVLMVVVKDLYIYVGGMPGNMVWGYIIGLAMGVLLVYLFALMLYVTNRVLRSEYVSLSKAVATLNKRLVRLYSALFLFILLPALLVILSESILHTVEGGEANPGLYAGLIFILVVGIPIFYAYIRFFYTMPLIVMEDAPIWYAFCEAFNLLRRNWGNWARVFGVYAISIAIWILVSPDTLMGHLMKAYRVSAFFDFIVFAVALPILMNLIVFMLNELRLRQKESE